MIRTYHIVKVMHADAVIMETSECGRQIWTRCTVRTHKPCEITGRDLHGMAAFRPVTNQNNRMCRIDARLVDKAIKSSKRGVLDKLRRSEFR